MTERAVIGHTETVYAKLLSMSKEEDVLGQKVQVFRGSMVEAYRTTSLPMSYYSTIFKQLDHQGCINVLQKGARNMDSVVVLLHPPSAEAWAELDLTDRPDFATLLVRVEALEKLVGGMNIVEALRYLEQRINDQITN